MKTKQLLPLLLLAFFGMSSASAQFTKIGITAGYDTDLVKSLSADYITSSTTLDVRGIDLTRFDKSTMYSMACENAHVRIFTGYDLPKMNASAYFALVGIFNRWDDISYATPEGSYISFGSVGHEIAVESSLDKRYTLGNILYLDLGVGVNSGVGFGGYSYINTWNTEIVDYGSDRDAMDVLTGNDIVATSYTADINDYAENKVSLHSRVFGKVGVGMIFFDRVEIGMAVRYGAGLRSHIGGTATATELRSFELNSAYRF